MAAYSAELTGFTDLALPLSRLAIRRSSATLALEVSVPSVALAEEIATRAAGDLVLYIGATELARAPLERVREYRGSNSATLILFASDTVAGGTPATVDVEGVSYRALDDSVRRIRCSPAHSLRIGDTVQWAGESLTAAEIVLTVDADSATMEIAE